MLWLSQRAVLLLLVCAGAAVVHAHWSHGGHHHHGHHHNDRVRLADVQTLTLYSDQKTTGRRSAPVPQMECVGGNVGCHSDLKPTVMQCRNMGSDGVDVQWQCSAELDDSVKLGRTDVTCEGYDYPEDPYVLAGSCGVQYTLESTGNYGSRHGHHHHHHSYNHHSESGGGSNLLFLIVLAFLTYQLFRWCRQGRVMQQAYGGNLDPNQFRPGGPYGNQPPPGGPHGPGCTATPPTYDQAVNGNAAGGGWNFWHGLGLGGLLGYMAPRRRHYGYGNTYGYNNYGYGARPSFFNRGGLGGMRRSPSSSSSSSSTGTHTSTGYGRTTRR